MSDCAEVTTRNRLKTIIGAVSGITAARVTLGVKDLSQADDFFNNLITNGPWIQIKPAKRGSQDWEGHYEYNVTIRVYQAYAKGADNDNTAIENTNALICAAIGDKANYSPTVASVGNQPIEVSCEQVQEDTENEVDIPLKYELTARFLAGTN